MKRYKKESVLSVPNLIWKINKKGITVVNWWTFKMNLKVKTKKKITNKQYFLPTNLKTRFIIHFNSSVYKLCNNC